MFGPVSEGMRLFHNGASIAVVGYSEKPHRVSLKVTQYLLEEGSTIVGINPSLPKAEKTDIAMKANLGELDGPVDIIQVFRNSSHLQTLANEILNLSWRPKMVWCQQGVVDIGFQQKLEDVGIAVVMDACPYALRSYL